VPPALNFSIDVDLFNGISGLAGRVAGIVACILQILGGMYGRLVCIDTWPTICLYFRDRPWGNRNEEKNMARKKATKKLKTGKKIQPTRNLDKATPKFLKPF
jgi:hypothetical protein